MKQDDSLFRSILRLLPIIIPILFLMYAANVAAGNPVTLQTTKSFIYKLTPSGKEDYKRRTQLSEIVCEANIKDTKNDKAKFDQCVKSGVNNPTAPYQSIAGKNAGAWEDLSVTQQETFIQQALQWKGVADIFKGLSEGLEGANKQMEARMACERQMQPRRETYLTQKCKSSENNPLENMNCRINASQSKEFNSLNC